MHIATLWHVMLRAVQDWWQDNCLRLAAALAYYDAYRRERLPANLLQAQRDYFGAHTYERFDERGAFHTDWIRERRKP